MLKGYAVTKNESEQLYKMVMHKTKPSTEIEKYMLVNVITINNKTKQAFIPRKN